METPNPLRGFLYPSSRVSRCPHFNQCPITGKCKSFDKHSHLCNTCESRSSENTDIGGLVTEGEITPDISAAYAYLLQNSKQLTEGYKNTTSMAELIEKDSLLRKSTEIIANFMRTNGKPLEECIIEALYNEDLKKLLGPL